MLRTCRTSSQVHMKVRLISTCRLQMNTAAVSVVRKAPSIRYLGLFERQLSVGHLYVCSVISWLRPIYHFNAQVYLYLRLATSATFPGTT